MATVLVEFGPIKSTRYPELVYQRQGSGNWRFIDNSTGKAVGPSYRSEWELWTDLDRYAQVFGC